MSVQYIENQEEQKEESPVLALKRVALQCRDTYGRRKVAQEGFRNIIKGRKGRRRRADEGKKGKLLMKV